MKTFRLPGTSLLILFALLASSAGLAQSPQLSATLDRMFNKHEFASAPFGPARWLHDGAQYTTVEPSSEIKGGQDIVEYDTASGKRTVLVSATKLVPAPGAKPLRIEDYTWSPDNRLLLIFTNSKKVWRLNTRGDYWVLDLASGKLTKLGGDAPESSLMFAKFSPDSQSVAFVRANNIYVQDLSTYAVRALTTDGSTTLINGTSDWVNEEELKIRDGFRWSPDSQSIAFWQFDTTGVGDYTLINDTAQEYPVTSRYLYPQPGTTNSAVRAGVVSAQGGSVTWINLPGDPRQHYIARLDWVPDSNDAHPPIPEPPAEHQHRLHRQFEDRRSEALLRRHRQSLGRCRRHLRLGAEQQIPGLAQRARRLASRLCLLARHRTAAAHHQFRR